RPRPPRTMRKRQELAEPVPHPLFCPPRSPLLRVLLGETPRSFRALLWGSRTAPPMSGADLRDLIDRKPEAGALLLTSIPLLEEASLAELPSGRELARLQRE